MVQAGWEMLTRGAVDLISADELRGKLALGRPLRVKLGVDPTSPDLHLGHTVVLTRLRAWQEAGHRVIFIIGDFTASIGDPSGRDATRPRLKRAEILRNAKTYQRQVFKILRKDRTEVLWNSKWLGDLFDLRRLDQPDGLHGLLSRATLKQVLERDDFSKRLEAGQPLTLLEALYPLYQGYDSVAVKADVEVGGSDQLFNLLMGREVQKDLGQPSQVVMTFPLLEGTDGVKKMSKSYGNHIALDDPPEEMFGKVMSIPDALTPKYAELLTDLSLDEVRSAHPMEAKKRVARVIVERFHGAPAAVGAQEHFEKVFSRREVPEAVDEVRVPGGLRRMADLLVLAGLVESKKAAQRLLEQGAVEVDGNRWLETEIALDGPRLVRVGKRRFKRLIPTGTPTTYSVRPPG